MAWKAVSIALTGAFGILGLLKDFKNKHTKKITVWGWVSLVGIIVSSICGIAAQLKESSDDSARALDLAQKADTTLRDIERALTPIDDPRIKVDILTSCLQNPDLCKALIKRGVTGTHEISLMLLLFVDPKDAKRFVDKRDQDAADRRFYVTPELSAILFNCKTRILGGIDITDPNACILLSANETPAAGSFSDGKIKSALDIPGTTLIVWVWWGEKMIPRLDMTIGIRVKSGVLVEAKPPFEDISNAYDSMYRYVFPQVNAAPN
jgi:hypothetical protein